MVVNVLRQLSMSKIEIDEPFNMYDFTFIYEDLGIYPVPKYIEVIINV